MTLTNQSGIFSLEDVRIRQNTGYWRTPPSGGGGSPSPYPYGYFGGGTPGPFSRVDRVDYSNDTATASPKGPLSVSRYRLAATGKVLMVTLVYYTLMTQQQ